MLFNELKSFRGQKIKKTTEVLNNLSPEERQKVYDMMRKDERYIFMQKISQADILNADIEDEYIDDEKKKRMREALTSPEMLSS